MLSLTALVSAYAQSSTSFQTIVTWTDGTFGDRCGSPGYPSCSQSPYCTAPDGNYLHIDPYTSLDHCDLNQAPVCFYNLFPPFTATKPLDFTFYVISDTHLTGDESAGGGLSNNNYARHVRILNDLPNSGLYWPSAPGFDHIKVGRPVAVLTTGDDTDVGREQDLGAYRILYEPGRLQQSLVYPLLPGLGNHDVTGTADTKDCDDLYNNCSRRMFDYAAGMVSCVPGVSIDNDSHNYSWDWGPIHFIQLHTWGGETKFAATTHPSGLPWLIQDLQNRVGSSNRPVVILQHYGFDNYSVGWWGSNGTQYLHIAEFLNIIRPYNVVAMFTGHVHKTQMVSQAMKDDSGRNWFLDDFVGGTGGFDPCVGGGQICGGRGTILAVRVTDSFLDVLPLQWHEGDTTDTPTPTNLSDVYYQSTTQLVSTVPFFTNATGCRKIIGKHPLPLATASYQLSTNDNRSFTFTNVSGQTLNGPFFLQTTAAPALPASYDGIAFVDSCAQGPVYFAVGQTSLAPNASTSVTLNSPADQSTVTLYSAGTDAILVQATASLSPGTPLNIPVTDEFNSKVPIHLLTGGNWLRASLSSNTTPATLSLSVDPIANVEGKPTDTVEILSTDSVSKAVVTVSLASLSVPLTSSPPGATVRVAGVDYVTPADLSLTPGTTVRISTSNQKLRDGTYLAFERWTAPPSTVPAINLNVGLNTGALNVDFNVFVPVTYSLIPSGGGTVAITPPPDLSGLWSLGKTITVTATPAPHYVFAGWSGGITGSSTSQTVTLSGPLSFAANFTATASVKFDTLPAATTKATLDGSAITLPATVDLTTNEPHTVVFPLAIAVNAGTLLTFEHWTDGVLLPVRTIVGAVDGEKFTGQYLTNYQLNTGVNPAKGGTVTGGGWNGAGNVTLTATPSPGYVFSGFTGDQQSTANPFTFVLSKPSTVIANFAPSRPNESDDVARPK